MLNQSDVTTRVGTTRKTILVDELNSTALSCMVTNTGVEANGEDKKIVKAGTPVAGDLKARDTAFTVAADGTNAVGVILHDVDVTKGTANSQVVIDGTIDVSKLESDVVTMVNAAASKLPTIKFVK